MAIKYDTILQRLIKDMQDVRSALRHVTTNLPLYDVANENTPDPISTDQDNYVPGNYDVLRIEATADLTISGIANGKKGRFLEILNVGTGRITYSDGDTGSLSENRFNLPYDLNVTQLPNARVKFYYDSTQQRWTLSDAPNIQGEFGKYTILGGSSIPYLQTISQNTWTKLAPDSVITDEWEYWDSTNKKFVVPDGERGIYLLTINFTFSSVASGTDFFTLIYVIKNAGVLPAGDAIPYNKTDFGNIGNAYSPSVSLSYVLKLESGDDVTVALFHDLAAGVKVAFLSTESVIMSFAKAG